MQNKQAFTLIELLVVILIIGILAAVAVPQYQKTIIKSRLANMKQIVSVVKTAEEAYYLANGAYTNDWGLLDIDLPACPPRATNSDVLICDNYFMLDPLQGTEPNLRALYCPEGIKKKIATASCAEESDFIYKVWLENSEHPNQVICQGNTALGQAVCNNF